MNAENLEMALATQPIAEPGPMREARLLEVLRGTSGSGEPPVWWRRPIPLWQAVAACMAVAFTDAVWLRPAHSVMRTTNSIPVVVQVDGAVFEEMPRLRAAADYSSWRVLTTR